MLGYLVCVVALYCGQFSLAADPNAAFIYRLLSDDIEKLESMLLTELSAFDKRLSAVEEEVATKCDDCMEHAKRYGISTSGKSTGQIDPGHDMKNTVYHMLKAEKKYLRNSVKSIESKMAQIEKDFNSKVHSLSQLINDTTVCKNVEKGERKQDEVTPDSLEHNLMKIDGGMSAKSTGRTKNQVGKRFMFAFMPNLDKNVSGRVLVTAEEKTVFTVKAPFYNVEKSFGLDDYGFEEVRFLKIFPMDKSKSNRVIEVTAEKPISLYVYNDKDTSVGVTVLLPVESLGKTYILDSRYTSESGTEQAVITATTGNTTVHLDFPSGERVTVRLNEFEVYMSQSSRLSGTIVTASYKVNVQVGHSCANIPFDSAMGCDFLSTSVPPISITGRTEYFVVPGMYSRSDFSISIVAPFDDTHVSIYDSEDTLIESLALDKQASVFRSYNLPAVLISASKYIMVNQFGHGSDGGLGDPSMSFIPSTEHYTNRYFFRLPSDITWNSTIISFVIDIAYDVQGLRMNFKPLPIGDMKSIRLPDSRVYRVLYVRLLKGKGFVFDHVDGAKFAAFWYSRKQNGEIATTLGYEV